MPRRHTLTVKQLHDETGKSVRQAGASRVPIPITDRGRLVAYLASPSAIRPTQKKRIIVPGYEAHMAGPIVDEIQAALDEVRGDR